MSKRKNERTLIDIDVFTDKNDHVLSVSHWNAKLVHELRITCSPLNDMNNFFQQHQKRQVKLANIDLSKLPELQEIYDASNVTEMSLVQHEGNATKIYKSMSTSASMFFAYLFESCGHPERKVDLLASNLMHLTFNDVNIFRVTAECLKVNVGNISMGCEADLLVVKLIQQNRFFVLAVEDKKGRISFLTSQLTH
jgi:hypothetical protein